MTNKLVLKSSIEREYLSLVNVFMKAYKQAAEGKGRERHVSDNKEAFHKQQICEMARRLSVDGPLYQAVKKIYEASSMYKSGESGRALKELRGALNYIAAAYIVMQEKSNLDDLEDLYLYRSRTYTLDEVEKELKKG